MNLATDLNSSQLAAIQHDSSATLVVAGPGSGKTRTLVSKVAAQLEKSEYDAARVLALTFTNKAAREMLDRVDSAELDLNRCLASTFHSFACDMLRQHGHLIGIQPSFSVVVDDDERQAVLQGITSQDMDMFSTRSTFARFKETIETIGKVGGDPFEHSPTVRYYTEGLLADNRLDVALILPITIKLFREFPETQRLTRLEFPFVCVDEFQDTNSVQMEFLQLVASESGSGLFVVADDDQLIYAWNGASVDRLSEVRDRFAPKVFQLPENYRCSDEILSYANRLIENNELRDVDKLPLISYAESRSNEGVFVHEFQSEEDEIAWICSDIFEKYGFAEGRRVAVLCRTRRNLEVLRDGLSKHDVDACVHLRQEKFLSPEFRWLQSVLKAGIKQDDRISLKSLSDSTNELFGDANHPVPNSLSEWRNNLLTSGSCPPACIELLGDPFSDFLEDDDYFTPWVDIAIESLGLVGDNSTAFEADSQAWEEISGDLEMQFGEDFGLAGFVQELEMRSKAPTPPDGAVSIMTIHGAKGLEFEHVYIAGMQEGTIPYYKAVKCGENSPEVEEERRACFVAITRAESRLTLTYATSGFGYRKYPSRFLTEMELAATPIE